MKRFGLLFVVVMFLFVLRGFANAQDPGIADTVEVDRIALVDADEKVVEVNVWLWYDEAVDSFVIPLTFFHSINEDIFCDSVAFGDIVGGDTGVVIKNETEVKEVLLWATRIEVPHSPGREILATLYFHTGPDWKSNEPVELDTTSFEGKGIYYFRFFQTGGSHIEWVPEFFKGVLKIEKIPELDSPKEYILLQNYPNPFNAITTIEFVMPNNCQASLEIYNILGQKIKVLLENARMPTGICRVDWDGTDQNGKIASSGIYFYRLSITNSDKKQAHSTVKRMVFLK